MNVKHIGTDTGEATLEQFDAVAQALLSKDCKIVGSYVYKRMLLGLIPQDIDVVAATDPEIPEPPAGVKIDCLSQKRLDWFWEDRNPTFIDAVGLSRQGFVPAHERVQPYQVDFVVKNMTNGFYCRWPDMRAKDEEFFQRFTELPRTECEAMGFFSNRLGSPY